jgi:hypothetical protein
MVQKMVNLLCADERGPAKVSALPTLHFSTAAAPLPIELQWHPGSTLLQFLSKDDCFKD